MDRPRRAPILNVDVVEAVVAAVAEEEGAICAEEDTEAVAVGDMEEDADMAAEDLEAAAVDMDVEEAVDMEADLEEAADLDLGAGDIRVRTVTINRICRIPMSIRAETEAAGRCR